MCCDSLLLFVPSAAEWWSAVCGGRERERERCTHSDPEQPLVLFAHLVYLSFGGVWVIVCLL